MELPVKLGFEQGGYFAALSCLFQSELTVLPSAGPVCLPSGFVRADCGFKSINGRRYFGFAELAFPDGDDIPFEGFEPLDIQPVSAAVALDFVGPEPDVGLRDGVEPAAFVPVPEASVDENDSAVSWQDDVRCAGKAADILAEAEAAAEQFPAYRDLRIRVFRPDVRHAFVPLVLCHCVGHVGRY